MAGLSDSGAGDRAGVLFGTLSRGARDRAGWITDVRAMIETNKIPFKASGERTVCPQCNLRGLCLPGGLGAEDMRQLDTVIGVRRRVRRGQYLYRSGDAFSAIYAIRQGFFKTEVLTEDGRDQVTGFPMAGDFLGMDGISGDAHTCNAVALEDSEVCRIPFEDLERLLSTLQTLQRHFHKLMSREIVRGQGVMGWLGPLPADKGLAAFLLNLSQRLRVRGYSPTEFHLRMTRKEIGSHLGVRLQTVSRSFSRFQEEGYISVRQKHIRILDMCGLQNMMTPLATDPPCVASVPVYTPGQARLEDTQHPSGERIRLPRRTIDATSHAS